MILSARAVVVLALIAGCHGEESPPPSPQSSPAAQTQPAIAIDAAPAMTWRQWKLIHRDPRPAPPPPRTWPAGEFKLAAGLPEAFGSGDDIGTAHRVIGALADPQDRWAIVSDLDDVPQVVRGEVCHIGIDKCFDVATGKLLPKAHPDEPPRPYNHATPEVAYDAHDRVLVAHGVNSMGPLRWLPIGK